MKISQLEYFLEAAKTLNYTKAASNLYTSRQNISHAVKSLESELGAKLFAQSGNVLLLTADGSRAIQHAESILNEVAKFKRDFLPLDLDVRPLFILIGTNIISYSQYDIPKALGEIDSIDFSIGELNCSDCYDRIVSGDADISFIVCMPRTFPGCEESIIHEDYLYLLLNADSDLTRKDGLLVEDLMGHTLMIPPGYEFQMGPLVSMLNMKGAPKGAVTPISSFDYVEKKILDNGSLGIASPALRKKLPETMVIRPLIEPGTKMGLRAIFRQDSPLVKLYRSISAMVAETILDEQ